MSEKACGIVCEYNPFHNGHRYQLEYVRKTYQKPIVCAMSGSFVQRAEPAFAEKRFRAEQAVRYGASLVLEIPFPYSCMTAEKFAETGVRLLAESGMCSHLAFGSECADVGLLTELAAALGESATRDRIIALQKECPSLSYARARQSVLERDFGDKAAAVAHPNDILGIEYIKAIRKHGYALTPLAHKRTTAHTDGESGTFASSSYIREAIRNGEPVGHYLPDDRALQYHEPFGRFEGMLHILLSSKTPEDLKNTCEYTDGLERAVHKAAVGAEDYDELLARLKSKTLTDAKIRRLLLFGAFGVPKSAMDDPLLYAYILAEASDEPTRELLRMARKESTVLVARSVGAIRKDLAAYRQYERNALAEHLLLLSRKA